MRYLVIIEEGPTSFGAYVPDVPGCIAAGESREEVLQLIEESRGISPRGNQGTGASISSTSLID